MSDQQRLERAIIAAGVADRWMVESKYDFDTVTRLIEDTTTPPEHRERLRKKLLAFRVVVDQLHEALYGPEGQVAAQEAGTASAQGTQAAEAGPAQAQAQPAPADVPKPVQPGPALAL